MLELLRSVAEEGQMAEAQWTIKEGCYEVVTEENRVLYFFFIYSKSL